MYVGFYDELFVYGTVSRRECHAKEKPVSNMPRKSSVTEKAQKFQCTSAYQQILCKTGLKFSKNGKKERGKMLKIEKGLAAKDAFSRVGLGRHKNPRWWVLARVSVLLRMIKDISQFWQLTYSHLSLLNSLEGRRGLEESTFIASRRRRKKDRLMNERKS